MAVSDEIIVIRDGRIRHIRETIVSEAPVESVLGQIVQQIPTMIPILPRNPVRSMFFNAEARRGAVLIETPPAMRRITVFHSSASMYTDDAVRRDEHGLGQWNVMFPYTYFLFAFNYNPEEADAGAPRHLSVGYSTLLYARQPIRSVEDTLYMADCPNVDSGGGICWGGNTTDNTTLSSRFDSMIQNFWDSQFNEDLGHRTPFGNSLTDWENASLDPLAWLSWNWWERANGRTVQEWFNYQSSSDFNAQSEMMANLNPDHIAIPELPTNFTVGRAIEWLEGLSPAARLRLLTAANTLAEANEAAVEEVPA